MPLLQQYFSRMQLVVIGGTVYNVCDEGKSHGSIMLEGRKRRLVKGEKLSRLEETLLEDLGLTNNSLVPQLSTYAKLVGVKAPRKHSGTLVSGCLPENFLVSYGKVVRLEPGNGEVSTDEGSYKTEGMALSIGAIGRRFQQPYRDNGTSPLSNRRSHYSLRHNLGFEINENAFHLYTKVQDYILYEKLNGNYYKFPRAKVATKLISNRGSIIWNQLVVMGAYTHPSLAYTNKPFQKICTGDFSYSSIKRKHANIEAQLLEVMHFARKVLTECYFSSGQPYSLLTDSKYDSMKVTGSIDKRMVTNS